MTRLSLLADENVDQEIVTVLRAKGYDVLYVAELEQGISDDKVLDLANQRGALLLTADKDFGELVYRQHRLSGGVVLYRLAGLASKKKAQLVAAAMETHASKFSQSFTVISPGMIWIRARI